MKGLIIIPNTFKDNPIVVGRYICFFEMLKKEFGFNIVYADNYDPHDINEDIIITYKCPHGKRAINLMKGLLNLPKNKKLIIYNTDIHGNNETKNNYKNMMRRADLILCPYDYAFRKDYSEFIHKYQWFPHFVVPHSFSDINKNPIMKCLVSGCIDKNFYPLRHFALSQNNKHIEFLKHPGYTKIDINKSKVGIDYYKTLRTYFCCLTTSSKFDYVVRKYFEIPATGSLLLANETPDLDKLGFRKNIHYIEISKHNLFSKLDEVLKNPNDFDKIRNSAMRFILENHSIKNRFDLFKEKLKETL